jgi:hypothetical protein
MPSNDPNKGAAYGLAFSFTATPKPHSLNAALERKKRMAFKVKGLS